MSSATLPSPLSVSQRGELLFPLAVMAVLVVLIVPLPTFLLDMLLTLNLGITILLLLVTLGVGTPMELSVFPTVLLLLTLGRLSLNVATTRLILIQADAGHLVETFGNFVVGGNLVVGLVVFMILIIIQFVVITKGATRISEVSARFVLDAMPGKQMAIDADLNSQAINDAEAKRRRAALLQEAEFYGTMDGAGKFVRGDAVAGMIITAINLIGGIIIGMMNGMQPMDAIKVYSILTVGDGLISQIPALIIATAAGILVTKSSNQLSLSSEIGSQFLTKRRPLQIGAGLLCLLALTPGMPSLAFLAMAGALYYMSQQEVKKQSLSTAPSQSSPLESSSTSADGDQPSTQARVMEEHLNEFLEEDRACIELGRQLLPLVAPKREVGLIQRISTVRKDLARRCGLWIPLVRVRDGGLLKDQEYRFLVGGQEAGRGIVMIGRVLAIDPAGGRIPFPGIETKDPAFGFAAKWILENDRAQAEQSGLTCVDAPSVIITHLREVLRRHAGDLLGREDLAKLIDKARETAAAVIDDLIPNVLSMGTVHRVLSLLLEERVPITNLTRILEALSHHAQSVKDPSELAERVRPYVGRSICDPFVDHEGRIHAITFDPVLELELRRAMQDKRVSVPTESLEALIVKVALGMQAAAQKGVELALLVDSQLRRPVRHMLARGIPDLTVIAFSEVPNELILETEVLITRDDIYRQTAAAA